VRAPIPLASREADEARAIIPGIDQPDASSTTTATRTRVLTGYRPTGPLHVGHWAGNVETMLALQADPDRECFFFLADWHMLNTHYDRTDELPGFVRELLLDWLAAGIDPERSTIYRQSDLPEVAELSLLLGTITPLGWLERVPSFKERLRDMAERDVANYGLLGYPVLQTADIAIVGGQLVPVGEDQVAHLEISREIVRRFNRLYGDVLVEPQPLLSETPLIPGSDGRKMSKSLDNAIWVRDDEDAIRASVRSFITDPQKVRRGDPGRPEICPIFALHRTFSPEQLGEIEAGCRSGELGCVDCKTILADHLIEHFRPYRERRAELATHEGLVERVLAEGAEKVRPVARATLDRVREAMRFS
jgi:tryptophanyl-tRNA synthetase